MCKLALISVLLMLSFFSKANYKLQSADSSINSYLISITAKKSFTKKELSKVWKEGSIPKMIMPIKFGFEVFDITYKTKWHDGSTVIASGMVFIPKITNKLVPSELIYLHGTKISKLRTINLKLGEQSICAGFAAEGYVVAYPDYVGLGNGERFHLYQHAGTEAQAGIDMMRAVHELMKQNNVKTDNRLFITGYSQGGHAAMAMHKVIQENYSKEFNVAASSPMSGAYDISGVQSKCMFEKYAFPSYLPYLLRAYDEVYDLFDEDFSTLFKAPYDTIVSKYYDGNYDIWDINPLMPEVPVKMLKDEYVLKYISSNPEILQRVLKDNDVYDWKPEAPMQLCYCQSDEQVNYINSFVAYDKMKENGSKLVSKQSGGKRFDHFQCSVFSSMNTKFFFNTIRKGSKKGRKGYPVKRSIVWLSKTIAPGYYIKKYNSANMEKLMGE
jgi:hypothetical protein